ncbi:c-type cytochrome [Paenibacillus harenae]|uniref:c-type cytochrome n=1 Tax=Paenibacillus harenae TaxID=306543 RepID=UPI0003FAB9D7|nr:cytochrome c [Paenibacillus harenae]
MSNQLWLRPGKLVAFTLLLLALAGCGGGSGKGNALDGPAGVISVYKANCVNCHGSELQGRIGAVTNLQKVGARMSAEDITVQIEDGASTMPGFKDKLSAEEIEGLAEWLAGKK